MTRRILIVEDDPDFAYSLELALQISDIQCLLAGSAEEAYQIFDADGDQVELAFFDIKLPGDDGISCFEKIARTRPDLTGIVMTGFRDEALQQRARDAGAVEILLKPFRLKHFITLTKQYISTDG